MNEPAVASAKPYGILHMPTAGKAIDHASVAAQLKLNKVIQDLSTNPRPDERESADQYGEGYSTILVRKTSPAYVITYRIDDAEYRVVIIAVSEARWKQ